MTPDMFSPEELDRMMEGLPPKPLQFIESSEPDAKWFACEISSTKAILVAGDAAATGDRDKILKYKFTLDGVEYKFGFLTKKGDHWQL